MPTVIFIIWWLTLLAATALLIGWQWRLAQRRAATWAIPLAYAAAVATTAAATVFVFLIAALILALFPPAPVGRALGIVALAAWGCQCRDRWIVLGNGTDLDLGRWLRQLVGAWVTPRVRGQG